MKRNARLLSSCLLALSVALFAACGGGSSEPGPGAVRVSLTGGSGGGAGFDNAWVTVRGILFHPYESAEPEDAGWVGQRFGDNETVTVNLTRLSNGAMQTVFDGVSVPTGRYRQVRLFVEPTRGLDNVARSAHASGLRYNNQVDTSSGPAPLRIPDAQRGIRLAGDFDVVEGPTLDLAIDFDIGHDVVEIARGSSLGYVLKPLLRYFDLARAGAIVGRIDSAAAADNAAFFVFKAEQPDADNTFRVVRRITSIADNTGRFTFYPLAPGRYDIVMRGRNRKTVIVRSVNVPAGGSPAVGAADLGTITMQAGTDFKVNATVSPTGSWVSFHQTLPGDPIPFEIRFRHVSPFSSRFPDNLYLSASSLRVGTWTGGSSIALTDTLPLDNAFTPTAGAYQAVAEALLYDRSAQMPLTAADNDTTLDFGALLPSAPAIARTSQGRLVPSAQGMGLTFGFMFAVRDGLIVDRIDVSGAMGSIGGNYTFPNLPGGSLQVPFVQGIYGLETLGWSLTLSQAVGYRDQTLLPPITDLRFGNKSNINIWMVPLR